MTNLIEQLGGYEKAKEFLNAKSYTIDELVMMQRSGLRTQHVEKALLEHRRQHNILEIGDKVFLAETENEIQTVTERTKELFYNLGFVHCTDKEIAQGYRDE